MAPSGKFVIRISPSLHAELRKLSQRHGVSLNTFCADALESCVAEKEPPFYTDNNISSGYVTWAMNTIGPELLGILLFGSQARGDQLDSSDVDLLIVVPDSIELSRELYARWDDVCAHERSEGTVNPHFVHLPQVMESAGSIWFEVALDGIVLFDQKYNVNRFLQSVRRAIADGLIERKYSHGHPYWVKHTERIHAK